MLVSINKHAAFNYRYKNMITPLNIGEPGYFQTFERWYVKDNPTPVEDTETINMMGHRKDIDTSLYCGGCFPEQGPNIDPSPGRRMQSTGRLSDSAISQIRTALSEVVVSNNKKLKSFEF